ncbi:keratin, type I cytoskeletal 10-like isoform X4 [Cloeon dipterum]|uniref:keratin, type I cytoskeletal 10-like isoform X4 n=1 Tax=Cloeon dipterum TaxID=197152 RepID=UPI00321FF20B
MIRPAALVLALAATGTLAASLSRTDANTVEGAKKPGGGYNGFPSFPSFPPYGYAAGFQQGNFGFPGSAFPAPFQMPFPPAPHAAFDFNSVFNAYISALQQYTDNLQKLQQQYQQTQAAIASSNPGPSYFVGSATGASTGGGPGQISVSAPPGSVVQHFEGPGGLQGVSVTTSGNGFQGFAGGASFGGGPFSAGSFGGSSSSSVGGAGGAPFSAGSFGGAPFAAESFGGAGGAPFAAGTFGSGGGNNGGGGGVFTSSSSGVSSVNGQTESFHQSTTGHVDNNGQVSSITVSKP